jgi:hypothetical protein
MSTHIDMAPNFAGTLLGITNGFGNTMGFLAPAITGYIINANQDLAHWRTVFFIGKPRKITQDSHINQFSILNSQNCFLISVVDPGFIDPDPDPEFKVNPDPDPGFC